MGIRLGIKQQEGGPGSGIMVRVLCNAINRATIRLVLMLTMAQ